MLDEAAIREARHGRVRRRRAGLDEQARLIRLEYDGAGDGDGTATPLLALVGKAVTFDSGGISLKPAGDACTR